MIAAKIICDRLGKKMNEKINGRVQSNSAQNINLVKYLYQAFAKRDIDAILTVLSYKVDWGEPENSFNPSGGIKHGQEGFLEWLRG